MVAELAVVGFVTGAISFVVTVRNAVSKVIEDVDAVHNNFDFLLEADSRLALATEKLTRWQKIWHIDQGCPKGLSEAYWGNQEKTILEHAQRTYAKAESVHKEFTSIYSDPLKIQRELGAKRMKMECTIVSEEDKIYKDLQGRWKRNNSVFSRSLKALFQSPIFDHHLKLFEASITNLEELSRILFINRMRDGKEDKWKENVDETSFEYHLLNLAESNFDTSSLIRNIVLDARGCTLELHLDHKTDPLQRVKTIEKASKAGALCHHFCLSGKTFAGLAQTDLSCTVLGNDVEVNRHYGDESRTFSSVALGMLEEKDKTQSSLCLQECGQMFIVQREDMQHDMADSTSECLRSFILRQKSELLENSLQRFTKEEKHRLAYELAEWTLLFFRTSWFNELCSCCIYRVQTSSLRTVFRARVTPITHVDTETGQHETNTQWCQEELMGMHIQRLGILLAEIALSHPIFELNLHPKRGVQIFKPAKDADDDALIRSAELRETVLRATGPAYLDAIWFCLELKETCNERDFYNYVVHP